MSDTLTKARTVRFGSKLDRSLSAEAARQKVSVSDLIRRAAQSVVETSEQCAGDWCVGMSRVLKNFEHCDLADSSVVVLSEKFPDLDVLTTDRRHFLTYRRADRSALPLLLPDKA